MPTKKIFWAITGLILFVFLLLLSLRSCTRAIYQKRSCTYCNIDNIELRTGVDIPSINDSTDCIYDEENDIKRSYFSIHTEKVDINHYIAYNKMHPIREGEVDFSLFSGLKKQVDTTPTNWYNLLAVQGETQNEKWIVVLDKKSGGLWVYIRYKD